MLNTKKFALAGGLYLSGCVTLATVSSLIGVPGFPQFTNILVNIYGPWGYSVSLPGILVGAFWGFIEGFIHIGALGWIYNRIK